MGNSVISSPCRGTVIGFAMGAGTAALALGEWTIMPSAWIQKKFRDMCENPNRERKNLYSDLRTIMILSSVIAGITLLAQTECKCNLPDSWSDSSNSESSNETSTDQSKEDRSSIESTDGESYRSSCSSYKSCRCMCKPKCTARFVPVPNPDGSMSSREEGADISSYEIHSRSVPVLSPADCADNTSDQSNRDGSNGDSELGGDDNSSCELRQCMSGQFCHAVPQVPVPSLADSVQERNIVDGSSGREEGGDISSYEMHQSYCDASLPDSTDNNTIDQSNQDGPHYHAVPHVPVLSLADSVLECDIGDRAIKDCKPINIIKIITYNLWQEGPERNERMLALWQLVQKHAPDVLLFQEMTRKVHKMFESLEMWGQYRSSVSPETTTEGIYSLVLSKLPVNLIYSNDLKAGGKFHVVNINLSDSENLTAVTSHLKSSQNQKHREKRMSQANEIISKVGNGRNVVFGGDMNWDDKLDGEFPLKQNWFDAWIRLRPGEEGYTYDTKTNPLLKGRNLFRKRLDRIFCKLKDFKVVSIEIIGNKKIQVVKTCDNGKKKNHRTVPSDHYGLLLTICSSNL